MWGHVAGDPRRSRFICFSGSRTRVLGGGRRGSGFGCRCGSVGINGVEGSEESCCAQRGVCVHTCANASTRAARDTTGCLCPGCRGCGREQAAGATLRPLQRHVSALNLETVEHWKALQECARELGC